MPARSKKPHQKAFLEAFSRLGSVSQACDDAQISRRLHYEWLKTDPDYVAKYEEAHAQAIRALEDHAMTRAFEGSDVLCIFLLKCRNPAVFGDRIRQDMAVSAEVDLNDGARQALLGRFANLRIPEFKPARSGDQSAE